MEFIKYIRTDRNGTKYYEDWKCPRCGGAGEADKWYRTGKTCYECGGTGLRRKPVTIKEYTPEHQAKLDERRKAREAKRLAENPPPSGDELKARVEAARLNNWELEGFSRDGRGYLHTGNTYKNKGRIKAEGGRWCNLLRGFVAPVRVECKGVLVTEMQAQEMCNRSGYIDPQKAWGLLDKIG